jgi:hypothetical protein
MRALRRRTAAMKAASVSSPRKSEMTAATRRM